MDDLWNEYRKLLLSSIESLTSSHAKLLEQVQNIAIRLAIAEQSFSRLDEMSHDIAVVSDRCNQIQKDLLVIQGQIQAIASLASGLEELNKRIHKMETDFAVQKVVSGFIGGLGGALSGAIAIAAKLLVG